MRATCKMRKKIPSMLRSVCVCECVCVCVRCPCGQERRYVHVPAYK